MLIFLPNLGMGGSDSSAPPAVTAAGGRRRYTLPDGRRVYATNVEIRALLEAFRLRREDKEPRVEVVEEGPQLIMEITDTLTREESIMLGQMIDAIEDEEAVLALLLN